MVELGTALRSMAADVETSPEVDGGELWARGRQRVRRQRLVAVSAALAVAVVVGWAALAAPSRTVVMPAGEPHPPAVPQNIYLPDPSLAGTAKEGPLGRLAVLGDAERDYGDFAFSTSVFGISATTGTYRFLDLPDQVLGTPVAMSPDGRRVAYWTAGPTTGEPYDDEVPSGTPGHVGGFAIYDSEDGSVVRAPFASEHGLSGETPFWVDSRTVVFEVWRKTTRTAARKVNTYFWTGSGAPTGTRSDVADISTLQRNRDGSLLTPRPSGGYDRVDVVAGGFAHVPGDRVVFADTAEQEESGFDTVSRSGRLLAAIPVDTPNASSPLMTGSVGADGKVVAVRRIGNLQNVRFLGWRDARTVLVAGSQYRSDASLYAVDLSTGAVARIGLIDGSLLASDAHLVLATDLLAEPLVHGRRPPSPPGRPWLWLALAAVGSAAGLAALVLGRRRRG